LRGSTPLRLLDPIEFEMRLVGAGVEHWCDLPFDEAMRDTPWEEFLERVVDLTGAKSFVLSPESAFGRNREGRLDRVRAWGAGRGIQVHPVSEARTGGEKISSTSIRAAIASGELSTAARALGRPHAIVAHALGGGGTSATGALTLEAEGFALPPEGEYQLRVGSAAHLTGRLPLTGRLMRGHLDPVAGRLQIAPEGLQRLSEGGGRLRAALLGRLAGRSGR
jgi:riboflavin kinase/FMN adenylyltransferase